MIRRLHAPKTPLNPRHARWQDTERPRSPQLLGWLAAPVIFAALLTAQAHGQEIPRPSYARQKAQTSLASNANFKVGEIALRMDARISTEYVDNVDLSKVAKADVVVTPEIGISAVWAMTKLNTLRFRAGIGYSYYFNSPKLNRQTMTISPDSALSFDLFVGDVKINLHNQFSLSQEAISQGSLSGVAQLERFTNTLGLSLLWDTNDVVWTFGYDHYSFLTLGGANSSSGALAATISNFDHSTDQVSGSIALKLNSPLIGGVEGTAFHSDYSRRSDSNYSGLSVGTFFEIQLTKYTHLFLSGGMKAFFSGTTAAGSVAVSSTTAAQPSSGDPTGFYVNMSFVHRLNRYYSDRLDLSHSDDVEVLGGHTRSNSAKYSGNWRMNSRLSLGVGLFVEDVTIVAGSALGGTVSSDYWRCGATLSTGFQISQHLDLGLSYQFLKKEAQRSSESYVQNSVTISLGYRF